jgi:glutathione S-transferase
MTTPDTTLFYTQGTCSLAAMIVLEWLGDPYLLCRVEKPERQGEAYRRINARGLVPALRVRGATLVEANAILAHLADRKAERGALPANGSWEREVANQWLSYFASGFHAAFWPYYFPSRYTTREDGHEAVREAAVLAIRRELGFVDRHLEGRDFMLGDRPDALDAYLYSMSRWANPIVDVPKEFANVFRHQKALAREPSVRIANALERGDAPPDGSACAGVVDLQSATR